METKTKRNLIIGVILLATLGLMWYFFFSKKETPVPAPMPVVQAPILTPAPAPVIEPIATKSPIIEPPPKPRVKYIARKKPAPTSQIIAVILPIAPPIIVRPAPAPIATKIPDPQPIAAQTPPSEEFGQIGARTGANAPGWGVFGDIYLAPIKNSNAMLMTRGSIGTVQLDGATHASVQLNEIMTFNQFADTHVYVGGGINIPLVHGSKMGINALAGASQKVNITGAKNEMLFLEAGYTTFEGNGSSAKTMTVMGGYKVAL